MVTTAATPPTEVLFYHLERQTLEQILPGLLERTVERGWRAVVQAGTEERLAALDSHLWTFRDDSFLPHGDPTDPFPERQPVYLTAGPETPNAPQALMLVDGAEIAPAELAARPRTLVVFDGADDAALARARAQWKAAVAAGVRAVYWAQDPAGRWTKKAEAGG